MFFTYQSQVLEGELKDFISGSLVGSSVGIDGLLAMLPAAGKCAVERPHSSRYKTYAEPAMSSSPRAEVRLSFLARESGVARDAALSTMIAGISGKRCDVNGNEKAVCGGDVTFTRPGIHWA
jgi:hypothetical protein